MMKAIANNFIKCAICFTMALTLMGCPGSDDIPEPELEQIPINRLISKIKSEVHGDRYCENGDIIEFKLDTLALTLNGETVTCSEITLLLDGHKIGTYSTVPFEAGSYRLDGISHGEHTFKLATTLSCEGYAETEVELDTNLSVCVFYERPVIKMKTNEHAILKISIVSSNGALYEDLMETTRELEDYEEITITPSNRNGETVYIDIYSQIDEDATNFDATIVSETIKWTGHNMESEYTFVATDYDWDSKVPVTCSIVSRIEGVHEGINVFFVIFEHYKYVSSAW